MSNNVPSDQEILKVNLRLGEQCWQHNNQKGKQTQACHTQNSFQESQICFCSNYNGRENLPHLTSCTNIHLMPSEDKGTGFSIYFILDLQVSFCGYEKEAQGYGDGFTYVTGQLVKLGPASSYLWPQFSHL